MSQSDSTRDRAAEDAAEEPRADGADGERGDKGHGDGDRGHSGTGGGRNPGESGYGDKKDDSGDLLPDTD